MNFDKWAKATTELLYNPKTNRKIEINNKKYLGLNKRIVAPYIFQVVYISFVLS